MTATTTSIRQYLILTRWLHNRMIHGDLRRHPKWRSNQRLIRTLELIAQMNAVRLYACPINHVFKHDDSMDILDELNKIIKTIKILNKIYAA